MPLGTLDRNPPPFFKQGTSALTKLIVFSFLSMTLMLADQRYNLVQPARWVLSIIMYPVQWVALRPQVAWQGLGDVFEGKQDVLNNLQAANAQLLAQAVRTSQLEQLELENRYLRELLELRQRVATPALAAEVLYQAGDPYTRKMVLDKGALNGVVQGSPVMDEKGILGQITRVHPLVSEITLVPTESTLSLCSTSEPARVAWLLVSPGGRLCWSCATWLPTLTLRLMTCSPPVVWMVSTLQVFRWPKWSRWSGAPIRCLRAYCVSRWRVFKARAM